MYVKAVLIAIFIQVVLTFGLVLAAAILRRRALGSGSVHPRDIALGQPNWPPRATQVANAFRNQFELPVLFYVLCILAIITRQADYLFVILAWLFVIFRLVHAYIHVTYNRISHRGLAFAAGCVTLMLMWIVFAVDVLIGL
ncbi:MAG TPA: MAPEG family protein [Xanthobacteraceae bacterium]|nr:MAPEG family protein [Xanthobacteraceae bacterium]